MDMVSKPYNPFAMYLITMVNSCAGAIKSNLVVSGQVFAQNFSNRHDAETHNSHDRNSLSCVSSFERKCYGRSNSLRAWGETETQIYHMGPLGFPPSFEEVAWLLVKNGSFS